MADKLKVQERIEGKTPNGGAYSIAYYQDEYGDPIEKSKATMVEIVEYDNNDNHVARTYGAL